MKKHWIEIDEDVWALLQKNADAFVEDPNDVLRRLLLGTGRRKGGGPTRRTETGADKSSPYSSLGDERRKAGGLTPRRMGKLLMASEFNGLYFDRASAVRGRFRTMFESRDHLVYFLNFNQEEPKNLWFKITKGTVQALLGAHADPEDKEPFVVLSNPAEREAWVIPVASMVDRYEKMARKNLKAQELVMNLDPLRSRIRLRGMPGSWDVAEYKREVNEPNREE